MKSFKRNLLVGAVILVCFFSFLLGVVVNKKITESNLEKEVEQTQIYPTGSFKFTFSVNEDVVDLEGKEALTILMEQFVMYLAEAVSSYRMDGNIEHIKILGARLAGDKEEEARLKFWLKRGFIPRPSIGD